MSHEYLSQLGARRQQAVDELINLVRQHYPGASFVISPAEDDPGITHIWTTVDLDEPEEVTDLTIDRELALLEQGIPVYVIPLRTPKKEAVLVRRMEAQRRAGALPPLLV